MFAYDMKLQMTNESLLQVFLDISTQRPVEQKVQWSARKWNIIQDPQETAGTTVKLAGVNLTAIIYTTFLGTKVTHKWIWIERRIQRVGKAPYKV